MSGEVAAGNAVPVLADHGRHALARARREIDPGCELAMAATPGLVALRLPEHLVGQPDTPELLQRLAAIARACGQPERPP